MGTTLLFLAILAAGCFGLAVILTTSPPGHECARCQRYTNEWELCECQVEAMYYEPEPEDLRIAMVLEARDVYQGRPFPSLAFGDVVRRRFDMASLPSIAWCEEALSRVPNMRRLPCGKWVYDVGVDCGGDPVTNKRLSTRV